jgi:hypothetical protein
MDQDVIPNEFRLKVMELKGAEPLDRSDVNYGNVTDRYVTLRYPEWVQLFGEEP